MLLELLIITHACMQPCKLDLNWDNKILIANVSRKVIIGIYNECTSLHIHTFQIHTFSVLKFYNKATYTVMMHAG